MFDAGQRGSESAPVPIGLPPITVQARLEPDPLILEPPIKTPEEQVADAERARLLRERQAEGGERPSLQPAETADKLRRDQEARDRARHDAVKRELAAMSVQGARRDVVIKMYSTSWCGVCAMARDYMRDKNIAFSEYDVEHDESARTQARALNPRASVPTISVDGDIMIGFAPAWLEGRIERAAKRRASH
jgi:glutaredoxin